MSFTDPSEPHGHVPPERLDADGELQARLAAQEDQDAVRLGVFVVIGSGLVLAAAIVAMIVVAL